MKRYAQIIQKQKREAVLLKSLGCGIKTCSFCDYFTDCEPDEQECAAFNSAVLQNVVGRRGGFDVLQVIDSASFCELPSQTVLQIESICKTKQIKTLITEQHWAFRGQIAEFKTRFENQSGTKMKFILGLETFDAAFRENVLKKQMADFHLAKAKELYNWVNLLCAVEGQTLSGVINDIQTALENFERVNVCMFIPNTTKIKRSEALAAEFYESAFFDSIQDNPNIEILDIQDNRAPDNFGGIGYAKDGGAR
jgi:hypothetical protein